MKSLNENMLLSLECPACLEYMQSPIYICVVGHSICKNCWSKLDICPTCNDDLSGTRNFSLETMSGLLYYPCHNSDYGCKENLRLNEMDDHLTVCSFRIYKCKVSGCSWRGRRRAIEGHFLNSHRDAVIIGPENWSRWKNSDSTIYLMSAHKEIFYVHMKTVKNYTYWVVQYIGKSEDTIQYYFQIDIFSDQFQNRKIIICENCQDDIKDDITEIIDSGYAVGIPIAVLETYRTENKEVWYNISIKKT